MSKPDDVARPVAAELHNAVSEFAEAPAYTKRLEPKVAALVRLAVYASACTLYDAGIDDAVARAMDAGASLEEIADVLASIAPLGNHTIGASLPVLLEEFAAAGVDVTPAPFTEQAQRIKDEFVAMRGYWTEGRQQLAEYMPTFFVRYMALSAAPWKHGVLEPKVRELMLVAIDASVAHMSTEGVRVHVRGAIDRGATWDELIGVLEVAATLGVDGFRRGMRAAVACAAHYQRKDA